MKHVTEDELIPINITHKSSLVLLFILDFTYAEVDFVFHPYEVYKLSNSHVLGSIYSTDPAKFSVFVVFLLCTYYHVGNKKKPKN